MTLGLEYAFAFQLMKHSLVLRLCPQTAPAWFASQEMKKRKRGKCPAVIQLGTLRPHLPVQRYITRQFNHIGQSLYRPSCAIDRCRWTFPWCDHKPCPVYKLSSIVLYCWGLLWSGLCDLCVCLSHHKLFDLALADAVRLHATLFPWRLAAGAGTPSVYWPFLLASLCETNLDHFLLQLQSQIS